MSDESLVKKIKRIIPTKIDSRKFSNNDSSSSNLNNKESEDFVKNINLILIADSQSSLEALENIVKKNSNDKINFNSIYTEVAGDVSDSVINLSKITQSSVLTFNVRISQQKTKDLKENKIH